MKKLLLFLAVFTGVFTKVNSQKLISEGTIVYDVMVNDSKADPAVVKSFEGATKVLYIKGSKTRSDLITSSFIQSTIADSKSDTSIILRELGQSKYLSFVNPAKRDQQNKKFAGITFSNTSETKTILGYDCKKVIAKLNDGSTYNVYYTAALVGGNKEYEYQFKDLPGFVLEYETASEDGKTRIQYSAKQIMFTPVPNAKFDLPKSGYRVL